MSIRGRNRCSGPFREPAAPGRPAGPHAPGRAGRPADAGRLARWERLAFTLAFGLDRRVHRGGHLSSEGLRRPVTSVPPRVRSAPASPGRGPGRTAAARRGRAPSESRRARSRRAPGLGPPAGRGPGAVLAHPGTMGVGIIDQTTGAVAVYGGGTHFATAGVEKATILASLLLDRAGPTARAGRHRLGGPMSDWRPDDRASDDGSGPGWGRGRPEHRPVPPADRKLGLRHTLPGPGRRLGPDHDHGR